MLSLGYTSHTNTWRTLTLRSYKIINRKLTTYIGIITGSLPPNSRERGIISIQYPKTRSMFDFNHHLYSLCDIKYLFHSNTAALINAVDICFLFLE